VFSALIAPMARGSSEIPAASFPPLNVYFSGPGIVANGTTNSYYINITGGPSVSTGYNYSYSASIQAKNTTGSSIQPSTGKSPSGSFLVNITSTSSSGVMTVVINASFTSSGITVNKTASFLINVVHPVVITIPIYNDGASGIRNTPVSLYVDGHFVQTQTVSVGAHQTVNVTFDWISYSYAPGPHTVTVVIDANNTLLFSNGARTTSITVYLPGNTFTEIDDVMISGIVVAAVFAVLIFFRRPKPRK
jgi:hypothetical protein